MNWYNVHQPSPEWFKLRCGRPTASRFDKILTPAQGKVSAQQETLIYELIEERFSMIPPERMESYVSRAMVWGIETEAEARRHYCLMNDFGLIEHADENIDALRITAHGSTGLYVWPGGFCESEDKRIGCSPDGLIAEPFDVGGELRMKKPVGCLELKCPRGKTQAEYWLKGKLPAEYRWQVNGHLLVTGFEWCDFYSYSPGFDPFSIRVTPGPDADSLRQAIADFLVKFDAALARFQ
jgi:YqaJ-like viral recombinase domain